MSDSTANVNVIFCQAQARILSFKNSISALRKVLLSRLVKSSFSNFKTERGFGWKKSKGDLSQTVLKSFDLLAAGRAVTLEACVEHGPVGSLSEAYDLLKLCND